MVIIQKLDEILRILICEVKESLYQTKETSTGNRWPLLISSLLSFDTFVDK